MRASLPSTVQIDTVKTKARGERGQGRWEERKMENAKPGTVCPRKALLFMLKSMVVTESADYFKQLK